MDLATRSVCWESSRVGQITRTCGALMVASTGMHGVYLSQLRPAHKKVTVEEIRSYFHRQPWQRIAFLLRKMQDAYFALMNQLVQGN